jgi:DNA polymerase I-like protein with 3'-5' exonuclease and polymerase domains/uracil-DNA glycosylase
MLVGEAPGEQEVLRREPFVGKSGEELNRMLHEAGIMRSECFITNVCRERPPDNDISKWVIDRKTSPDPDYHLYQGRWIHPYVATGLDRLQQELNLVQPKVVVAFGNVALWALTGKWGIKSWRGSTLDLTGGGKLIPAYHPAYILRDWSTRQITVQDLRRVRAASEIEPGDDTGPRYDFVIGPSFDQAMTILGRLRARVEAGPTKLALDIETRGGHIACFGIAWSETEAICIPFMSVEHPDGYWSVEEEAAIIAALCGVICHPNCEGVGQNFIYDSQYTYRHWRIVPNLKRDTMLGHHAQFVGLPKGLDYLSSMYCKRHVYWKDDGKKWDPRIHSERQYWIYNCTDCVRTYEADTGIQASIDKLGLREQHDFQMQMFWPVLETMIRGVRIDKARRAEFSMELVQEISAREAWFETVLGHKLNPRSPKQMQKLFYEDFAQKAIINRKSRTVTCDDDALQTIAKREPLLRPLVNKISEHRSLGVYHSTFVEAKLDTDGRTRCSYNIAGTETLRLSSSKNAFDSGLNLQNIPEGGKKAQEEDNPLILPNVRTLFIPDEGYTFFNADLDRADLQVVVWESDDAELKQMLLEGVDIHAENARILGVIRPLAKAWVHGTNYGGGPRTMAIACGISIAQAEYMRARWFAAHPGIAEWHKRVEGDLRSKRYVQNAFGYRRYYFDRIEGLLPEALAWIPQSTVALVINKIWLKLYQEVKDVQVLLQVHDSLAGQFPTHLRDWAIGRIRDVARSVLVPYPRPLCIPLDITTSTKSWGDCH